MTKVALGTIQQMPDFFLLSRELLFTTQRFFRTITHCISPQHKIVSYFSSLNQVVYDSFPYCCMLYCNFYFHYLVHESFFLKLFVTNYDSHVS